MPKIETLVLPLTSLANKLKEAAKSHWNSNPKGNTKFVNGRLSQETIVINPPKVTTLNLKPKNEKEKEEKI